MSTPQATASRRRFWLVVGALVIAELACALESNMILVALSRLYEIYGDPVHVGWLITGFSLASAVSATMCSRLGDLFGRRRVLLIMLGVAVTGSVVSAVSHDLNVINFGRVLQGASMSVLPLAFGILREHSSERQLNIGVGILGGTFSFGVGLGAILGGYIVDNAPWQTIFIVSASVAAAAILAVTLVVPPSKPQRRQGSLDLIGGGLFVVPITALLLSLSQGARWGWDTWAPWGLLVGGVLGLMVWTRHELRHQTPLIDVRLLRHPQIATVNLMVFVLALGPSMYPQLMLPLWQQPVWTGVGLGITATLAGIVKLPTNLTGGAAAIAAGFLARRFGMRTVIVVATFMMLAAWAVLAFDHSSLAVMVLVCVLVLAPAGTVLYACAPSLIIEAAPPERTSEVTGLTQVIRSIGMSIGAQVLAVTLASSSIASADGTRFPDERAYGFAFVLMTALSVALAASALAIPRSGRMSEGGHAPQPYQRPGAEPGS